jgi:hypothetical protein
MEVINNGGPSAIILGIGILWQNGKLAALEKLILARCSLLHKETDRRLDHLETWDGEERRR